MVHSMGGEARLATRGVALAIVALALFAALLFANPAQARSPIDGVTAPTAEGSWIAQVLYPIAARSKPGAGRVVKKISNAPRYGNGPNNLMVLGTAIGGAGRPYVKVHIPMRPNGTYGWIPADTVSLHPTHSQIVISLRRRTIDLYRFGKHKWHGPVAIGAPGRETPVGHYFVATRFVPYHDPFLGVFAEETSAYSKLTEWPGGGVVGIHGTSLPQLLGKAVSHGCVRVSNTTARRLRTLAPLGTPIWIKK